MLLAGCGGGQGPMQPLLPISFAVTVGSVHVCSVMQTGAAYCWGYDGDGELGNGTSTGPDQCAGGPCSTKPVAVAGGLTFAEVSGGGDFACGLTTTGAAYCWGVDSLSELGIGTTTGPQRCPSTPPAPGDHACSTTPVAVEGGLRFTALSAGTFSACGVTATGTVYCWGDRATANSTTPVAVAGGLTFIMVSVGSQHACGLTHTGAAYCWGDNSAGQLGDGTTMNSATPVAVTGALSFSTISAGEAHTCGITPNGVAYCWGDNYYGQLGSGGTSMFTTVPMAVAGGLTFRMVSAANRSNGFTCGLTTTGAAYCWGYNFAGQLGNGTDAQSATPVAVSGGLTFVTISAGGTEGGLGIVCGLTATGAAYCWGADNDGQLGNGTSGSNSNSSVPVRVVSP